MLNIAIHTHTLNDNRKSQAFVALVHLTLTPLRPRNIITGPNNFGLIIPALLPSASLAHATRRARHSSTRYHVKH